MALTSVFYPDVLIESSGCPEHLIDRHIVRSVVEFCQRTLCHKVLAGAQETTVNTIDYNLEVDLADARIIKVMDVFHGKDRLHPMSEDDMADISLYTNEIRSRSGRPKAFFRKDELSISLYPYPEKAEDTDTLTARVAVAPTPTARTVDDRFAKQYYEAIIHGALAGILNIPGKAWSDPKSARYHEMEFVRLANREKNNQAMGNVRADRQVRFVRV